MSAKSFNGSLTCCRLTPSTHLITFKSVLVVSPKTFDTLSTTWNLIGYNCPLYSHNKVAFPDGMILCPPKATSLAFDFVNKEFLIELNIALDMTLHCAPVAFLNDKLWLFITSCTIQVFLPLSQSILSTSRSSPSSLSSKDWTFSLHV